MGLLLVQDGRSYVWAESGMYNMEVVGVCSPDCFGLMHPMGVCHTRCKVLIGNFQSHSQTCYSRDTIL